MNAKAKETKHRWHPELKPGVRIQYRDKNEATRAGRIRKRDGNFLSVKFSKERISIADVAGYWRPKVKASPENLIKLEAM